MTTKRYNIPIEAPEVIAKEFIDLICQNKGFVLKESITTFNEETMLNEVQPLNLTEEEIFQQKLDFVGNVAGKCLREIAENQQKLNTLDLLKTQSEQAAALFTVKSVITEDLA